MCKWDTQPSKNYFIELKRVSKNQIIWGANFMSNFNEISRGWICWNKLVPDTFKLSQFEIAYSSFNIISKMFNYAWSNEVGFAPALKVKNGIGIHPCQKPVALYKWLLKNYAKEGDKIIDTHFGSLSIAIACADMGFSLDAWEIDADYFYAATKRLDNHTRQLDAFTEQPKVNIHLPDKTLTIDEYLQNMLTTKES